MSSINPSLQVCLGASCYLHELDSFLLIRTCFCVNLDGKPALILPL